jgi:hypothetical protein
MKNTFIYYLSDKYGNIRYVGKTKQYLKQRLYAHIIECKTDRNSHKISFLSKGERPIIDIVDEVPEEEWEFWEQYWISQFKTWGFNLTNLTTGGQGGNGYKHSNESKQKMRISKLGTTLPIEQRKKISESVKLKAKEDPFYNRGAGNSRIHLNRDLLYQKYIIENLSLNKCASFFNVSKKTVFTNITEYGFKKDKSNWKEQLISNPKKIVLQFDKNGNFIKEWNGLKSIEGELGIDSGNISSCCRGKVKSVGGFIWKYK